MSASGIEQATERGIHTNMNNQRVELLPNQAAEPGFEYGQELAQLLDKEMLHQAASNGLVMSVPAEILKQNA